MTLRHRPRPLASLALAALLALAAGGCSGSAAGSSGTDDGTVTIGLMWPQSGPYKAIGDDEAHGWQLYLDIQGGTLGGHPVKVVTTDEGDGKQTALNAAKKLLDQDHAVAIVGTASADATDSIKALVDQHKVPFVGTGGRPSDLSTGDLAYIWHASFLSREPGQAIADYLRTTVDGPVYAIGPDYQGGWDEVGGFTDAFTAAGGKLANPDGKTTWTPWPDTTNFLPYLNRIQDTKAKAVYCFYAGTAAIQFVQQYKQAGLTGKIPLYAAGFLTEGGVLKAEGADAAGVRTVMDYSPTLDNATNGPFATAFQQKYATAPDLYNVTAYDGAHVLDLAIAAAGPHASSQQINAAIGHLGSIDSPRGAWRFSTQHSPVQAWYLREVQNDGRAGDPPVWANRVVQNLTTLGN